MLTQQQAREYNRFKKLTDFLVAESSVYNSFNPFTNEVNDYNNNFEELETLIPDKTQTATGITTDKTTLKHEVASNIALVCRKTRAYAIRFNQPELAAQTNTNEDKIFHQKDADIMAYAASVTSLVTPLLAAENYTPYGVTQESLDTITGLAASFNNLIGKAKQKDSGNTVANPEIDKAINKLHANIINFDLLVDEFEATHPDFVQGYHINSSVDKVGIRHSGIEGTVTNASGEPINNANIKLDETNKTATSDLLGIYRLDRITPDDYKILVSAAGYTSQSLIHHISRGKVDEVNFKLGN